MTIKFKDARYKHQKIALGLKNLPGEEKERTFIEFALSMVESWDFKDDNGNVIVINGVGTFDELRVQDIEDLSSQLNRHLFPDTEVKKTSALLSPSGSTKSGRPKKASV